MKTHEQMFGTTTNPCPPWCNQHRPPGSFADPNVEQHLGTLWALRTPVKPEHWLFWLYISSSALNIPEGERLEQLNALAAEPEMALVANDPFDHNVPFTIKPAEARHLAAALIHGAEIVEATLTAVCPSCGEHAQPTQLELDAEDTGQAGMCTSCVVERWGVERTARRQALKVIR